ncbi:Ppx/GppA family phosphatase [Billgrantia endophytica]|uniref:Ppx/GppA family phosphatase n=1 Tax=Billgrantia endophytica TaxID=2033802 RepID=A0A2N7U6V6_9GAMM|nr:Ppx/GppA family phosphatase [Halomonas endophytica]
MPQPMDRPRQEVSPARTSASQRLAAIDLGSNSFHLLVADYQADRLQVVSRLGEKVQLAAGLDDADLLSEDAMQRALRCLSRFTPLLDDIAPDRLRVVGTSALRTARNSRAFVERAEALLGCPIDIISGHEEARLIYQGAAHALPEDGRRLVVDIGGGSTEFAIGEHFEPLKLESLDIGCVTFTRRHFANGRLCEDSMRRAERAALSALDTIRRPYRDLGWTDPVGSSGTIKAVASVIAASSQAAGGGVTRQGLFELRRHLVTLGHLDNISMPGLKLDRARIFPAGVAILGAIFEALDLSVMRYTDGALREGVLHDMLKRQG